MTAWRRDLHAHPEFGFEERRTSAFIAAKLREFGLDEVAEGVGGTGVVGTLKRGRGNRSIALRADMDALRITEQGEAPYRSQSPGIMHACGHDGHTAMLLGAARQLAADGFDGIVRFIFQPAEEWGRGALAMLADGLMARFPSRRSTACTTAACRGHFQTRRGRSCRRRIISRSCWRRGRPCGPPACRQRGAGRRLRHRDKPPDHRLRRLTPPISASSR